MYARLVEFSGADPEKRENAIETIHGTVIPMLRTYEGYEGYIALYDPDKRQARSILLWASKEAAETAEESLAERRQKIAGAIGLTIESADLYEAPVVEMEAVRV